MYTFFYYRSWINFTVLLRFTRSHKFGRLLVKHLSAVRNGGLLKSSVELRTTEVDGDINQSGSFLHYTNVPVWA